MFPNNPAQPRGTSAPRVMLPTLPSITRGRGEDRTSTEARGPPAEKNAGGRYHESSRTTRPSPRDGFNGCFAISLGTGLSCPHLATTRFRALRGPQHREARTTRLDRTSQAHSPARLRESPKPDTSTAPRLLRSVTIGRNVPLHRERDSREHRSDLPDGASRTACDKLARRAIYA